MMGILAPRQMIASESATLKCDKRIEIFGAATA